MRTHTAIRRVTIALVLALSALAARPSPVASGPRPPLTLGDGFADPWEAPVRHADARFATLPYDAVDGRQGVWVLSDQRLPLRVVIEQQIVDRFGFERVVDALTVWNDVPGSRFALEVAGTVDTGADRKRRDGISRVFLDRTDCDGDYLARAHLHPGQVVEERGHLTNFFWEADIGICPRMDAPRLARVLRHEVAHVAGLGHLCNPADDCWLPGTGQDNHCRVMFPAAYPCQERTVGDDLGLLHLYPRLPRIRADGRGSGSTMASVFAHQGNRSVNEAILVPATAEPRLQVEAAHLAGLRDAALLLVGPECTDGPAGQELNRVLAVHADVTLVGGITEGCETELTGGWGLTVQRLGDHAALLEAARGELQEPATAYVVGDAPGALADAVLALPAALRRGAPLLRADGNGLTDLSRRVLRETPSIERVEIVGGGATTTRLVEVDARALGLDVDRTDGGYLAATSVDLWRDPGLFSELPHDVLVTSTDPDALVTTAALAASLRWPVLLTSSTSLDGRIATTMRRLATGGLVVGDEPALGIAVQVAASRAAG